MRENHLRVISVWMAFKTARLAGEGRGRKKTRQSRARSEP